MRSEVSKEQLITEFPDLLDAQGSMEKEVYAHFGLAFFKFALVEHSLINIWTFSYVAESWAGKKIKNKSDWEATFDKGYDQAKNQTFGNLLKKAEKIDEFTDLVSDFSYIKNIRNYFTHHFMREESIYFSNEDGCWFLLQKIASVRRSIITFENNLRPRFEKMCSRHKLPLPSEIEIGQLTSELLSDAQNSLKEGSAKAGWEL